MTYASPWTGHSPITATARVADNLALYGFTPGSDAADTRPMPDGTELAALIRGLFAALAHPLADTALEPEVGDLMWSLVDLFHRKGDRINRQLDDNELRQRDLQAEQDGSEIQSVKLERLIEKGQLLLDKREAFETLRDTAAEAYEAHTGTPWRPRSGSMVNHKAVTAALIESRDFLSAKRRSETEVMLPKGTKIAFAGGLDYNDHVKIWDELDKVHAKYPDMVLIHGGNDRGAERIASCWAANRKVTEVLFKPDWKRDAKAAPFKRNDRIIELLPQGLIVYPGNGITDNLADKAKAKGIRLLDRRG